MSTGRNFHFLAVVVFTAACFVGCSGQTTGIPGCPECVTEGQVRRLIDDKWEEEKSTIIDQVLDDINFSEDFERITGISFGAVVAILIVLILVPNVIITGIIFLCCFLCKCGVFRKVEDGYYDKNTTVATSSFAPTSGKPVPPPKPSYSPGPQSPAVQQSSSVWPWGGGGRQDDYEPYSRNQNQGIQNPSFNRHY